VDDNGRAENFDAEMIYSLLTKNESYETVWGANLSLDESSVWNVTGDSSLASLTLAEGAVLAAPAGGAMTIYVDVAMDNDDLSYDASMTFVNLTYKRFTDRFAEFIGDTVKLTFYDDIQFRTTNRRMWELAEHLLAEDIPIRCKEHIPNPYQHFVALDLFAYFSLAANSRRRADFLRVMNRPKRYLSREAVRNDPFSFTEMTAFYADKPWIAKRIGELETDLTHLSGMNPYAGVNYIRKKIGYDLFVSEYAKEHHLPEQELFERLQDLQEAARQFRTMDAWKAHIEAFTKDLRQKEKEGGLSKDAVTLATLHGAKGLEFDRVYLYDMNAGVMPYHKAMLPDELEEERRMVYVGMTRAKKELILLALRNEKGEGQGPSPYIAEALGDTEKNRDFLGNRFVNVFNRKI